MVFLIFSTRSRFCGRSHTCLPRPYLTPRRLVRRIIRHLLLVVVTYRLWPWQRTRWQIAQRPP
jgi:hypothetical protein